MSKEISPLRIPNYDQYAQFCFNLNDDFREIDPLEINEQLHSIRMALGIHEPIRIGSVFVMSDSLMYTILSAAEGVSESQIKQELKNAEDLGIKTRLTPNDFFQDISREVSRLQQKLDSPKPMDVTVKVSHVYEEPYITTLNTVTKQANQLGGIILPETEVSPVLQTILKLKTNSLPYNFTGGVVVRFHK